MVADTAPKDLRGTAYGFFNLLSGLAILACSVIAGLLWDSFGSALTFAAGAMFATLTLLAIVLQPRPAVRPPPGSSDVETRALPPPGT